MEPHNIELPRRVIIGNDVLKEIRVVCDELNLSNGLVLADHVTAKIAGEKVAGLVGAKMEIAGDVTYQEMERFEKAIAGKKTGYVIGVGGGRVIDFGKLLSFRKKIPFISVPTAPSHDGIASERVSVKERQERHSIKGEPPIAIIADIGILLNAPHRLVAAGAADVISNYSAVYDWKLGRKKGEYYSDYSASLSLLSAEIVMFSVQMIKNREERGMRNLVEALISSGIAMSLAGTSRPASGSEHSFSHVLDILGSKALHGEQCGVGCIVSSYMQGQDWVRIRDVLRELGAPTTARELGVKDEMAVEAVVKARSLRSRHTIFDEKDIGEKEAREACRETGVTG